MEDLPFSRTAALVPEFAVKDLPLGQNIHDDDICPFNRPRRQLKGSHLFSLHPYAVSRVANFALLFYNVAKSKNVVCMVEGCDFFCDNNLLSSYFSVIIKIFSSLSTLEFS